MARPKNILDALPGLSRFYRYFSAYFRQYRWLIAGSIFGLIFQAFFRLLEPWPLKFLIDHVVYGREGQHRFKLEWLSSLDDTVLLIVIGVALLVITAIRALIGYYTAVGFAQAGTRILTDIRNRVFTHLHTLSLSFFDRSRNGDLVIRIISDIGMLKEVSVTALMPFVGNILILFGMLAVMFWMHWQLTLLVIMVTPLLWLITMKRSQKIQAISRKNRKREGAMAATAAESISAMKTIQSLSLSDYFIEQFSSENKSSLKEGVQIKRLSASLERTVDVLIAFATALVLSFGGYLVLQAELSAGALLVFIFYLRRAFRPLRDFAKYTARLAKASAAGERVIDLLDTQPQVVNGLDAVNAQNLAGDIAFRSVYFGYHPDQPVIKDFSLDIVAGQRVAIVGESGVGKSTLASLLLRLYDPDSGAVCIDGNDIKTYTLDSLRQQISVVLQDSVLFATTIRENITMGVEVEKAALEQAARQANIHDFILSLPDGYDTMVGERGMTLSLGQRQRIAIARAAIRQSPILLFDEATTGLDKENEAQVVTAMYELARGKTAVIITHRPETARRADEIVLMENGEIADRGSHAALCARNAHYAQWSESQASGTA